eukprot:m.71175 g.71175  ORF g.71175 m.71175 type:complete len:240 (+) comp14143_c0_seq3:240-959(+)
MFSTWFSDTAADEAASTAAETTRSTESLSKAPSSSSADDERSCKLAPSDSISLRSCSSILSLDILSVKSEDAGWTVLKSARDIGSCRVSNPETRSLCSIDSFCVLPAPSSDRSPSRASRRSVQTTVADVTDSLAGNTGQKQRILPEHIGRRVRVRGYDSLGTLRFVGPHHVDGLPRCGIELDKSVGLNDGLIQGHRYYYCKPKHGLLTIPQKVTLLAAHPASSTVVSKHAQDTLQDPPT